MTATWMMLTLAPAWEDLPLPDLARPVGDVARSIYEAIWGAGGRGLALPWLLTTTLFCILAGRVLLQIFAGGRIQPEVLLHVLGAYLFVVGLTPLLRGVYVTAYDALAKMEPYKYIAEWRGALDALFQAGDMGITDVDDRLARIGAAKRLQGWWGAVREAFDAAFSVASGWASMAQIINWAIWGFTRLTLLFGTVFVASGGYFFIVGLSSLAVLVVALTPLLAPFVMLKTTVDMGLRPIRLVLQAAAGLLCLGLGLQLTAKLTALWVDQKLGEFCPLSYPKVQEACGGERPGPCLARLAAEDHRRYASIVRDYVQSCALVEAFPASAEAACREHPDLPQCNGVCARNPNDPACKLGEVPDTALQALLTGPTGASLAVLTVGLLIMSTGGALMMASPLAGRLLLPAAMFDAVDLMIKTRVLAIASAPAERTVAAVQTAAVAPTAAAGAAVGAAAGAALGAPTQGAFAGGAVAAAPVTAAASAARPERREVPVVLPRPE